MRRYHQPVSDFTSFSGTSAHTSKLRIQAKAAAFLQVATLQSPSSTYLRLASASATQVREQLNISLRNRTDLYILCYRSPVDLLLGDFPNTHSRAGNVDMHSDTLAVQLRHRKIRAIHDHQYRVSRQSGTCHLCNSADSFLGTERTLSSPA